MNQLAIMRNVILQHPLTHSDGEHTSSKTSILSSYCIHSVRLGLLSSSSEIGYMVINLPMPMLCNLRIKLSLIKL